MRRFRKTVTLGGLLLIVATAYFFGWYQGESNGTNGIVAASHAETAAEGAPRAN